MGGVVLLAEIVSLNEADTPTVCDFYSECMPLFHTQVSHLKSNLYGEKCSSDHICYGEHQLNFLLIEPHCSPAVDFLNIYDSKTL